MAQEPILIIDDNPSNVKLAQLLLVKAGFEVRTAGDSEQALETLRSFRPRLILMDIQLPGMDGLKLTRLLKDDPATRDSIIVAVTAYAMRGDEERAKGAGCDGYMSKPIDTRTFVDQVRQFLDRSPALPPKVQATGGDPNDLLRELRNRFIGDGVEASRRYLDNERYAEELETMRRVVHHWAGMGGTLGFPEITREARELEETLQKMPWNWKQRATQAFEQLHDLFARGIGSGDEVPFPTDLVENLKSKQVGLIGFSEGEAKRVREAFQQVHATARDLGALSQGLGIKTWESVLAQPILEKPVLLVSSRTAVLDSRLALLDRAGDFILAPWDSEELLCRARRMIGQKPAPPTAPPPVDESSRPLVVIADDDPMIHSLLAPMLAKAGLNTHSARDGQEALDAVKKLSPAVLILDIGMPRVSGMSVLTDIRKAQGNHTVQVLMLSVRQQQGDINMAFGYGANDYAVKPFDPEDVVLRVMRLLPKPDGSLSLAS
jgi:two-component system cell cycle response regulator DivK